MSNQDILIESNPFETRVALLEQGRLVEIFHERAATPSLVGNVYLGRVHRVLPGMAAAFFDVGLDNDVYLLASENQGFKHLKSDADKGRQVDLATQLKTQQRWLLQVNRDATPTKRARVSTELSLAGRFAILLPASRHQGVSRQIDDPAERERLHAIACAHTPKQAGWILRTAAAGQDAESIASELTWLGAEFSKLEKRAADSDRPRLIQAEESLAIRVLRDLAEPGASKLEVDGRDVCEQLNAYYAVRPGDPPQILHTEGLFQKHKVDKQIDAALMERVWLPKGGSIVIQPTEALVSIDVNTGSFVGSRSLENTVLETNIAAAEEIARQIRLRNLGGILVIDFIDMTDASHRRRVVAQLRTAFARDRVKTRILKVSDFGLVEVTRKRSRADLQSLLTRQCPTCRGQGRVKSLGTLCLAIRRELLRAEPATETIVQVNPTVERALNTSFSERLAEIGAEARTQLVLTGDPALHPSQFLLIKR